jgi:2,3-bisphosphoglycerate-dependent phosphoglycerate mutase
MKKVTRYLLVACLMAILHPIHAQKQKITTFILVRHAEKVADGSKDPELSEVGKARAQRLMDLLQRQEIDAIYSTNYKRTMNTVTPLAEKLGMTIQPYEAFKEDVIGNMIEAHQGKTIVVVGHSNNVPWIANLLLGTKQFGDYDESYYENVLIVNVLDKGVYATTLQIKY